MMSLWFKNWFGKNPAPYSEWYERYKEKFKGLKYDGPISAQDFVVIDTETTGLDTGTDEVISIGAVKIHHREIELASSLSLHVKPVADNRKPQSIEIHGLIKTGEKGMNPDEAVQVLFEYLGTDIVVGHHIRFDVVMLEKLSKAHGGGPILNKIIDTSTLARRLDNPHAHDSAVPGDYTLDQLCQKYNIAAKARHTADGDAFITAILFWKLMSRLEMKGISRIREVLR
jgi:DNA polymerase-3 subunit epsilon